MSANGRRGVEREERWDVRDGGDERAVGREVAPGGEDGPALNEGGLHCA